MKANRYLQYFMVAVIAMFLAACSATTSEDAQDKKTRLESLKTQQANISKEIKKLEEEIAKENPDAEKAVKAKEVAVQELTTRSFDHYIQTQGKVEAEDNIMVSAKSMGVVTNVLVNEGQQVSKGQVLAQIDNSVISSSIEGMKSQLELAKTVY